jgi:hypothetical protein
MYWTAGAELVFDARQMGILVSSVEDELDAVRDRT